MIPAKASRSERSHFEGTLPAGIRGTTEASKAGSFWMAAAPVILVIQWGEKPPVLKPVSVRLKSRLVPSQGMVSQCVHTPSAKCDSANLQDGQF